MHVKISHAILFPFVPPEISETASSRNLLSYRYSMKVGAEYLTPVLVNFYLVYMFMTGDSDKQTTRKKAVGAY